MEEIQPTDNGLHNFIERCSALAKSRAHIRCFQPAKHPCLFVVQPHPDDVALSIGGLLSRIGANNTTIITIFSESRYKSIRLSEDSDFAKLIGANIHYLDFTEHSSRTILPNSEAVSEAVIAKINLNLERSLLLAPAAVARHFDHRVAHEVAVHLGCSIFWEDVAFWGIYAQSVDDRVLFSECRCFQIHNYTLIAVDISEHIEAKARMLDSYNSQSTDVWRPLRYAWTAARELGAPFAFCERLFVHDDAIAGIERNLRGTLVRSLDLRYGTSTVRTGWIR